MKEQPTLATWGNEGGPWAVVVHGGAGDSLREGAGLRVDGARHAAAAAAKILQSGGSALDAVQRAVFVLEDDPLFNAGTGASLNADGKVELDAAIMEGKNLRAGAVCALPPFLHPIDIARAALDDGRHVLYAGEGAARFATLHGFAPSTHEIMTTPEARARWESWSHRPLAPEHAGTVGAVARDISGSVAAATSTGGTANKSPGRVGDSPLLGAGTYADDEAGACSATGHGEWIMRLALAKTAVDLLRTGVAPERAARDALDRLAARLGGSAGVILVDGSGRAGLAHTTPSMVWAAQGPSFQASG